MEENLENIIQKYLDGTATPEEIRRVETYYRSFSDAADHTDSLTHAEKKALEEKMFYHIARKIAASRSERRSARQIIFQPRALRLAAAVSGLLILAFFYVTRLQHETTHIATAFGEVKEHVLPDGSIVTLNGNSSIAYQEWMADEPRTVTLSGEAYFSVTHTEDDRRFVVTLPGKFEVEVLGTEFSVTARESQTSVVLNSGVVRINGLPADSAVILKPGQRIALDPSDNEVVKTEVDPERYSSWKEHRLVFDATPLSEIVNMLEETYGYTVTVENEALLTETFTGTIPNNDIGMLVIGLQKIGLKVEAQGRSMHIRKQ